MVNDTEGSDMSYTFMLPDNPPLKTAAPHNNLLPFCLQFTRIASTRVLSVSIFNYCCTKLVAQ